MTTSETGRIFDVRRFSTHDGSGIRTTVFFKGCPLRCAWCHNPEGIDRTRRPLWFGGKCIRCGSCAEACGHGGVELSDDGLRLNPDAPEDWDAVMDECPTGALRWDSRDVNVEALMAEIRRDLPFYVHGGGGVTLSGGDPLLQPDFAAALLRRCREEGIHTAVETELHAPAVDAKRVLAEADMIYADLKLMDSRLHRQYTGAGNELILTNLSALLQGSLRNRVTVRMPMIPGVTATEENIAAAARFIAGLYADVRLELLNYNPLAAAKYPLVGRSYGFAENLPRYTPQQMAAFVEIARQNGVWNMIEEV